MTLSEAIGMLAFFRRDTDRNTPPVIAFKYIIIRIHVVHAAKLNAHAAWCEFEIAVSSLRREINKCLNFAMKCYSSFSGRTLNTG